MHLTRRTTILAASLLTAGLGSVAGAAQVSINIENTMEDGSFFFTPMWVAVHNGQFDSFTSGMMAGGFPGLE